MSSTINIRKVLHPKNNTTGVKVLFHPSASGMKRILDGIFWVSEKKITFFRKPHGLLRQQGHALLALPATLTAQTRCSLAHKTAAWHYESTLALISGKAFCR